MFSLTLVLVKSTKLVVCRKQLICLIIKILSLNDRIIWFEYLSNRSSLLVPGVEARLAPKLPVKLVENGRECSLSLCIWVDHGDRVAVLQIQHIAAVNLTIKISHFNGNIPKLPWYCALRVCVRERERSRERERERSEWVSGCSYDTPSSHSHSTIQ